MIFEPIILFVGAAADAPQCDHGRLTRTTVAAIAEEPDAFVGQCVSVKGFSDGRSLFASKKTIERHLQLKNISLSGRRLENEMMGVYYLPELSPSLNEIQWEKGLKWTLTGQVDTCERMHARTERRTDEERKKTGDLLFIMTSGHCHYLGGPVLLVQRGNVISESD